MRKYRRAVDRGYGAQQRRLLVERVAAVGAEHRRDAKAAIFDEGKRRGVPSAVAAGFKRGAQAAVGEGGRVGLATHQLLAGKVHHHAAAAGVVDKAVVLFRRHAAQGLEPVREMRCAMLQRPGLHRVGDLICRGKGKSAVIEHQRAKKLGNASRFTHDPDLLFQNKKFDK